MRFLTAVLMFGLAVSGVAADPYQGWTVDQLKAKIGQLEKQLAASKKSAASNPAATASVTPVATATADLKVDDFEGRISYIAGQWWTGADDKSGSTISPAPFVHTKGGAEGKYSARVKGKLGANKEPWPWAVMTLVLPYGDLRAYKAIQFWAKGDGQTYSIKLVKKSVTDDGHFTATFPTTSKWKQITVPFSEFKQPDFGKKVDASFDDIDRITFLPTRNESPFDFSIDDVILLR